MRDHLAAFEKYQSLTRQKKELLAEYKKAKEEERIARMTRVSKAERVIGKLNSDLNLDLGRRQSSSGASKRASDLSVEERLKLKD